MLTLENVRFRYSPGAEPYRFDLEVGRGEIVGIAGPSGAGKSTLLDLVAGFLTPEAGIIALDGRDLVPLPPELRPVSILFQADNLFEHLSAYRNVALGLPANEAGHQDRAARIRQALNAVGLEDLGNRPVAKLSGGQKQRVALARTLLRDKPVLLLDEPFAALDAETAAEMHAHVARLVAENGWHALVVSHHAPDLAIAGRVFNLEQGRLSPAR